MAGNTAACYLRSSKDRHDVSIDAQRRELRALAKSRGLTITAEFVDVVESGKDVDRDGYKQLVAAVHDRARGWDTLFVLDTSRLSRRRVISIVFEEHDCKRNGVRVIYKSLPDSDPLSEMLLKSILQTMDEHHSILSRQKGLAGMAENVRAGFRAGGRAPFGYQLERVDTGAVREGAPVVKSRLIPNADAPAMRTYLRARAKGTSRALAAREAGLTMPANTLVGIEWNALTYAGHTVWNVHNERQPGVGYPDGRKRRPRAEWMIQRGTHKALITERQAEQVLGRLEVGAGKRVRRRGDTYLLSGILRAPDGTAWHGAGLGRYRYERAGVPSAYVRASEIEQPVVRKVMEDLQAPATVLALTRAAQAQASELEGDPATELRKAAKAAQAKIDRMLELAAGMDDPAPVLRKVEQLEQERAGIAARIAHAEAAYVERSYLSKITEHHVRALLVDFAREIQQADRPHLKEALARMVDRIELDPATLACVIHYRIGAIGRDKVASPRVADLNPTLRLAMPMAWG